MARRAIQIGVRNEVIKSYSKDDIVLIEDISAFVAEQFRHIEANNLDELLMPDEKPLVLKDKNLASRLNIDL